MIIFLDIDGVVATKESYKEYPYPKDCLDRRCIANLNELILGFNEKTFPCNIVISSHWRYLHSLEEMQTMLKNAGLIAPVIDTTKGNPQDRRRDHEIFAWLEQNHWLGEYIAIDDDKFDMTEILPQRFIYIEKGFLKGGLTNGIVERYLENCNL